MNKLQSSDYFKDVTNSCLVEQWKLSQLELNASSVYWFLSQAPRFLVEALTAEGGEYVVRFQKAVTTSHMPTKEEVNYIATLVTVGFEWWEHLLPTLKLRDHEQLIVLKGKLWQSQRYCNNYKLESKGYTGDIYEGDLDLPRVKILMRYYCTLEFSFLLSYLLEELDVRIQKLKPIPPPPVTGAVYC